MRRTTSLQHSGPEAAAEAGEDASGGDATLDATGGDATTADVVTVDVTVGDAPSEATTGACNSPADCPAANACTVATCIQHVCGTTGAARGTACQSNGGKLCDGAGACVACLAPSDCPASTSSCAQVTCNGGACGANDESAGAACTDHGGRVCDAKGDCVACNAASDCAPPFSTCLTNACAQNACEQLPSPARTVCYDTGGSLCDGSACAYSA
jgi:hypothetical protein